MTANVLLIGNGGREHTIAWKLRQSPGLNRLSVVPGNAGIEEIADEVFPVQLPSDRAGSGARQKYVNSILAVCKKIKPDLVIVQTERAFELCDPLRRNGYRVFGPFWSAAQIELSKIWWHKFTARHDIPSPRGWVVEDFEVAREIVESNEPGSLVIKADARAGGKGVRLPKTTSEAVRFLQDLMLKGSLGKENKKVLIQERVRSEWEVSFQAFTDGKTIFPWPTSCDHKLLNGKMTGGVGVYSPAFWLDNTQLESLFEIFTVRTVRGLADEHNPFCGVIYPGLIVSSNGRALELETNARMGDPETQALLPNLKGDLLEIMLACARMDGSLKTVSVDWETRPSVCVVLCSEGYPSAYKTGFEIFGLDSVQSDPDTHIFHSGTKREDGKVVTAGGRVLSVVATAQTRELASRKVYDCISRLSFKGMTFDPHIAE